MERGAKIEIYDIEGALSAALRRLRDNTTISQQNKELIHKFKDWILLRGLTKTRALFYVIRLSKLAAWLGKDFGSTESPDIEHLVAKIEEANCAPRSKTDFKTAIKTFYKWFEGKGEEYPKKVRWIKANYSTKKRLPEEILSPEDIRKLIEAAEHPRDKALIACLYESGCRIGELGTLKIKNVTFDKYGAILIVDGKTGMRRVRLISSTHYLTNWLGSHPSRSNPEAPLWINISNCNRGTPLRHNVLAGRFQIIAKKAGVTKRVNPHSFRHARATHLANKLTEAQMKEMFGWVQSSDMASVYVHLSGRDVDNALLKLHGLVVDSKDSGEFVFCPRCQKQNIAIDRFCKNCGMPLDIKVAVEFEEKREQFNSKIEVFMKLLEDEKVSALLAKRLAQLQIESGEEDGIAVLS